jgi:aminoglycoside phosphotransferase family enzyme
MPDAPTTNERAPPQGDQATLQDKVDFLSRSDSYPSGVGAVSVRETHMSWVFMAGDRVYKLKKPVRFPYLDFSTLDRRAAASRAELLLNSRLAPDVYLGVTPLTLSPRGLTINGEGPVVEWLVVMRRLEENGALDAAMLGGRLRPAQADRIASTLAAFYRHARRVQVRPEVHLAGWSRALASHGRVLGDPRLGLPRGIVRRIDRIQQGFLARSAQLLVERVAERRIVDAHGDLRPEHIWLRDPITIIDCLEFDPKLRALDPLEEVAFLHLECERLGANWVGDRIRRRLARQLGDDPSTGLFAFYRCHRAQLRARLTIAHLLDPHPRTPDKWPHLARVYLHLAAESAWELERLLRTPVGR